MPRYARITSNAFSGVFDFPTQPEDIAHKSSRWLPCPLVQKPTFDPTAEKVIGPTYTINASDVTEVWAVVALTAQEISDAKDGAVAGLNGSGFSALLKVLLNHENRLRTLESKANITMAQFKTGLKALL